MCDTLREWLYAVVHARVVKSLFWLWKIARKCHKIWYYTYLLVLYNFHIGNHSIIIKCDIYLPVADTPDEIAILNVFVLYISGYVRPLPRGVTLPLFLLFLFFFVFSVDKLEKCLESLLGLSQLCQDSFLATQCLIFSDEG